MAPRQTQRATDSRSPSPQAEWVNLQEFLQRTGHRVTEARRIILEHVLARDDHFTADQIAASLAGSGTKRVSRGTVYNTLPLLLEAGHLRKIRDESPLTHYESVRGRPPHDHMVCDQCGRFIEFSVPALDAIVTRASKKHGFTTRTRQLVLMGTCAACAGKATSNRTRRSTARQRRSAPRDATANG